MADIVAADGYSNVAVIHMVNAYGSGLADTFVSTLGSDHICLQTGYDEQTTTDFSSIAQSVMDGGCDSVMMVSYAADGGAIIDELVGTQGFSGQIYGGDGIAEEGLGADMSDNTTVAGIIASKPYNPNPMGQVGYVFAALCGVNPACAGGIYTAEAFDAVTIAAFGAFTYLANNGTISAEMVVAATGQSWNGASGAISFLANGDIIPAGFCIGEFTVTTDTDGINTLSYDCARYWDPVNGVTAAVVSAD
jgi:ABC-type branched-subunit amino acid transport system substrate-binding protein